MILLFWSSTAALTDTLFVTGSTTAVLLAGALMYRIVWTLSYIFVHNLLVSSDEKGSELERFANRGLVGKALAFCTLVLSCAVRVLAACAHAFMSVAYIMLPVIVISLFLAQVQTRWGDTLLFAGVHFNADSAWGSTLRAIVFEPLRILQLGGGYVLPAYNLLVFYVIHLPLQIIVEFFTGGAALTSLHSLVEAGRAFPALAAAAADYVRRNQFSCEPPPPVCWNEPFNGSASHLVHTCLPADLTLTSTICLSPNYRRLNATESFDHMRAAVTLALRAVASNCGSLTTLVNTLLYPLTDASAWEALENAINAVLYMIVGAPTSTTARCALGDNGAPFCTPDLGPIFDFAVAAAQSLGKAVDNWVGMIYLVLVYGPDTPCPPDDAHEIAAVWRDPVMHSMFGSNSSVLVRLNDAKFALTDGVGVVLIDHSTNVRRSYSPHAWPEPVNPLFGIAAVTTPAGDPGLLGCSCTDAGADGAAIRCGILTAGGTGQGWASDVAWEIVSSPRFLRCGSLRIVVQSIRWPVRRMQYNVELSRIQAEGLVAPCFQSGRCITADAAVYVIPSCGASVAGTIANLGCADAARFTLSNCYPYCMGVHLRNSPAQPLIMRGANTWRDGMLISERDCAVVGRGAAGGISTMCGGGGDQPLPSAPAADTAAAKAQAACTYSFACTAFVANKTAAPQRSAAEVPAYASSSRSAQLVMQGQPIVAAGGVFMRLYHDLADQRYYVDFPALTGDQFNEMSIEVGTPAGMPVTPAAAVPSMLEEVIRQGFITLPPNDMPIPTLYNPATLTSSVLWYAVNPSYAWIEGFVTWCGTRGASTELQVMLPTTYAAISLWKVRYAAGACAIRAQDGVHVCDRDVALRFSLDPVMDMPTLGQVESGKRTRLSAGLCGEGVTFNLWVEHMEYFDDLNVVASVRRGSLAALYELMWGGSQAAAARGEVVRYFVRPDGAVREGTPWAPDPPSAVHGIAKLCPALRFLPSVGTFLGKSLAASAHFLRVPLNIIANPFALEQLLVARATKVCPGAAYGHTAYSDCGNALISLDPFFESLYAANEAFWGMVAWLVSQVTPPDTAVQAEFSKFLMGSATYGQASQVSPQSAAACPAAPAARRRGCPPPLSLTRPQAASAPVGCGPRFAPSRALRSPRR